MKIFYSVELEANLYNDDTFCGTLEECIDFIKKYGYDDEDYDGEVRIAKFLDDGDPLVTEIITEW